MLFKVCRLIEYRMKMMNEVVQGGTECEVGELGELAAEAVTGEVEGC